MLTSRCPLIFKKANGKALGHLNIVAYRILADVYLEFDSLALLVQCTEASRNLHTFA